MTKWWSRLVLLLIIIVAVSVHFFALGQVPRGLHVDEVGMAVDAWNLRHFGTERHGQSYPVYLLNYGAGQSALYAYLLALLLYFLPFTPTVIRLPGALAGIGTIIWGSLLVKQALGSKAALYAAFLLTICPYFIMQARFGLDCNLFLSLSTLSLYLTCQCGRGRKRSYWILAGASWGLTLYTYALSYLIVPLFLGGWLIFLMRSRRLTGKRILAFSGPLFLFAAPLMTFVIINFAKLPDLSWGPITIPRMWLFRSQELTLAQIPPNLVRILLVIFSRDGLDYNSLPFFWTLYPVSIPFVLHGLFLGGRSLARAWRARRLTPTALVLIFLISVIVSGSLLGGNGPNINKLNGIFFSLIFCLLLSGQDLARRLPGRYRSAAKLIALSVYSGFFLSFAHYYFNRYPQEIFPQYLFVTVEEKSLLQQIAPIAAGDFTRVPL